jgi:hypothetical protein
MLRETMIRTMPVAMIAMEALWTERFQRLRGVMKLPPDQKWKPIQMIARAAIIPTAASSPSACSAVRHDRPAGAVGRGCVWPAHPAPPNRPT